MNEYDRTDAAFYDSYATGVEGDVQFYVQEAQQAGSPVLELGCGTGRVLLPIAEAGCTIVAHGGPLGAALKKDGEFLHPTTGHRVVLWETRQYDPEYQHLEQSRIFEELDNECKVVAKTYSPLTLRYVYRYEMQYLLELSGYVVEALYGDFSRGPFRYGGEQIWVAKRR